MRALLRRIALMVAFSIAVSPMTIILASTASTVDVPHSITNAIASASVGDTIAVGPGTYREALVVNKMVVLRAVDPNNKPIISPTTPGPDGSTVTILSSEASLEGFVIVSPAGATKAISIPGSYVSISNCRVTGGAVGISISSAIGVKLTDNEITGCATGLAFNVDADGCTVSWNTIKNVRPAGVTGILITQSANNIFSHNSVSGFTTGVKVSGEQANMFMYFNSVTCNGTGVLVEDYEYTAGELSVFNYGDLSNNVIGMDNRTSYSRPIVAGDAKYIDAYGNWWGSAEGPLDAVGTQEMPTTDVVAVEAMANRLPVGRLGVTVSERVNYIDWSIDPVPMVCNAGWASEVIRARELAVSSISPFSKKGQRAQEKVVRALYRATQSKDWLDCSRIPDKGSTVYNNLGNAVGLLQDILAMTPNVFDPPDLKERTQEAIDRLLVAARGIASTAIADVHCLRTACQKQLALANEALIAGDMRVAAGSPEKAINQYGNAWDYARKAYAKSLSKSSDDVNEDSPVAYALSQNYPNPFNPSTTISFSIPQPGHATLEVFNTMGQKVATLFDQETTSGVFSVQFETSGLASGTYVYRLRAGTHVETRYMTLLR
jgi:nitrous oxidase accessory protein NosD